MTNEQLMAFYSQELYLTVVTNGSESPEATALVHTKDGTCMWDVLRQGSQML